jgi:catechol 2,3-dioxygenase-like lactoylglutathione lyase family enzyme
MRNTLIVIYTGRLEECRDFYTRLGLLLEPERHGTGPDHYAAVLEDGSVFELYPAGRREPTGRLRLGFTIDTSTLDPGRHTLTDPDGRTVEVTASQERTAAPDSPYAAAPEPSPRLDAPTTR